MAFSDTISSFETWAFRSEFDDSWFSSEGFVRDTDVSDTRNVSASETRAILPAHNNVSSSAGSEPDRETMSVSKRPLRNAVTRKIKKRKSRVTKRSTTTFITADPANFRQLVQQVTGVQFGSGLDPLFKPELHRVGFGSDLMPTLDTSDFLPDHHQRAMGPGNVASGPGVGQTGGPGFDFDGFCCFPTLESWKVT